MSDSAAKSYPQASLREVAIALAVADDLLSDFDVAEDALAHMRRVFDAVETDPAWAGGRHAGDCTKSPMTCNRCVVEDYIDKARSLAVNEGFDV